MLKPELSAHSYCVATGAAAAGGMEPTGAAPGQEAMGPGGAAPASAAAAAPALATGPPRDPLEDLLEPTPSAASPEPSMPGGNPTPIA